MTIWMSHKDMRTWLFIIGACSLQSHCVWSMRLDCSLHARHRCIFISNDTCITLLLASPSACTHRIWGPRPACQLSLSDFWVWPCIGVGSTQLSREPCSWHTTPVPVLVSPRALMACWMCSSQWGGEIPFFRFFLRIISGNECLIYINFLQKQQYQNWFECKSQSATLKAQLELLLVSQKMPQ